VLIFLRILIRGEITALEVVKQYWIVLLFLINKAGKSFSPLSFVIFTRIRCLDMQKKVYIISIITSTFNLLPAEFLKWTCPASFFLELSIINVRNIKMKSQQYRAWLDCMEEQAGLALYCSGKG
jgi:hypothetical protein